MSYIYKDGDKKHPHLRSDCRGGGKSFLMRVGAKGFCSVRCAQSGESNSIWKGSGAGYMAAHGRVYRSRGRADHCLFGDHPGPYDWANLMGDYPDTADYAQMCRSCHAFFDGAVRKCLPSRCKRDHLIDGRGTVYSGIRNGKEVRQCRQCALDRAAERRGS